MLYQKGLVLASCTKSPFDSTLFQKEKDSQKEFNMASIKKAGLGKEEKERSHTNDKLFTQMP